MTQFLFKTRRGTFRIEQHPNGWQAWFGDEYFDGPFRSAQAAAEDIAGGHTAWPSCGDPSLLLIPEDLAAWTLRK